MGGFLEWLFNVRPPEGCDNLCLWAEWQHGRKPTPVTIYVVVIHSLHGSGSSGVDFSFRVRTPKSQLCSEYAVNPSWSWLAKQSPLRAQTQNRLALDRAEEKETLGTVAQKLKRAVPRARPRQFRAVPLSPHVAGGVRGLGAESERSSPGARLQELTKRSRWTEGTVGGLRSCFI